MTRTDTHEASTLGHHLDKFRSPKTVAVIDERFHGLLATAHRGIGHHRLYLIQVLGHISIDEGCRLHLEELVLLACLDQSRGLLGERAVEQQVNLLLHALETNRRTTGIVGTCLHSHINEIGGVKVGEILEGLHGLHLGADGTRLQTLHLAEFHAHCTEVFIKHLFHYAIIVGREQLVERTVERSNHILSHACLHLGAHEAILLDLANDDVTATDGLVHALDLVNHRCRGHVMGTKDIAGSSQPVTTHFPQELSLCSHCEHQHGKNKG